MFRNQKGAVPLLLLVAVVGLAAFLLASSIAPFGNQLLSQLFQKPASRAASEPISGPINPSPSPLPGDIDSNGQVDIFDYNFILTDFGSTSGTGLRSDLDSNNRVDIFDYNILLTNFGRTG